MLAFPVPMAFFIVDVTEMWDFQSVLQGDDGNSIIHPSVVMKNTMSIVL